jgi:predicted membrane protein
MGWIITNCVIVKKHQNTVMNDLVPVWLSQRYMFKARDENYIPIIENKINIKVSDVGIITAKTNASILKIPKVVGKVNILIPKRVVAKVNRTIDYSYIDGFDKLFGIGDTK